MSTVRARAMIGFLLCFLTLVTYSAPSLYARIRDVPWPQAPGRLQHHDGDGATDLMLLSAHQYWTTYGYAKTAGIPCFSEFSLKPSAPKCELYTHYPPGMFLLSSLLLTTFDWRSQPEMALRGARAVVYLLAALLAAAGICLLGLALDIPVIGWIFMAGAFGMNHGFLLFADNFFGHGTVLSLQGVILGLALLRRHERWYFFACLLSLFLSVELIPASLLAPALLLLAPRSAWRRRAKEAMRLWAAAILATGFGMLLRLTQNALYYGVGGAIRDWLTIIKIRIFGTAEGAKGKESLLRWEFFGEYGRAMLYYQDMLLGGKRRTWVGIFAVFLLLRKRRQEFFLLLGICVVALSWNLLFIQHSIIHLFTVRYVVWPYVIAFGLLLKEARFFLRDDIAWSRFFLGRFPETTIIVEAAPRAPAPVQDH